MKKLDLLKLRKAAGLSQKELADKLAVQPSFLSAIENGRSRFPDEKIEKLKEIVVIDDFEEFLIDEEAETPVVPPHTHIHDEADSLSQMLRHIHNLAHKSDGNERERVSELLNRIELLTKRNDRLTDRLDRLSETLENLREENFRLKDLLIRNHIDLSDIPS